jgi:hypothetical protein
LGFLLPFLFFVIILDSVVVLVIVVTFLPVAMLTLVIKLNPIAYDMVDLGEEVFQTILFALRSSFSGWRVAFAQFKQEVLSILPCLHSTLPFSNIMNLPFPYIRKRHEAIQLLPSQKLPPSLHGAGPNLVVPDLCAYPLLSLESQTLKFRSKSFTRVTIILIF